METDLLQLILFFILPMLFILVEVVVARNKNAPFGISCFKNPFFKKFVFLDLEAVERCQMDSLGSCLSAEEGVDGGILGFPRNTAEVLLPSWVTVNIKLRGLPEIKADTTSQQHIPLQTKTKPSNHFYCRLLRILEKAIQYRNAGQRERVGDTVGRMVKNSQNLTFPTMLSAFSVVLPPFLNPSLPSFISLSLFFSLFSFMQEVLCIQHVSNDL